MATTEGIGGPCPRCGESNCMIRTGTGTWYTFIACPDCLFAYGEHNDTLGEKTDGVVTGADVWVTLMDHSDAETAYEFLENFRGFEENLMDNPFDFDNLTKHELNHMVTSEEVMEKLYKASSRPEVVS